MMVYPFVRIVPIFVLMVLLGSPLIGLIGYEFYLLLFLVVKTAVDVRLHIWDHSKIWYEPTTDN